MPRRGKTGIFLLKLQPRWAYVRDIIEENDLFLYEFAEMVGTSPTQLKHWMIGRIDPSFFSLQCLCIALEKLTGIAKEQHANIILWGEYSSQ
jgi:hypothetical protein